MELELLTYILVGWFISHTANSLLAIKGFLANFVGISTYSSTIKTYKHLSKITDGCFFIMVLGWVGWVAANISLHK
jgi:hypothetical protein